MEGIPESKKIAEHKNNLAQLSFDTATKYALSEKNSERAYFTARVVANYGSAIYLQLESSYYQNKVIIQLLEKIAESVNTKK